LAWDGYQASETNWLPIGKTCYLKDDEQEEDHFGEVMETVNTIKEKMDNVGDINKSVKEIREWITNFDKKGLTFMQPFISGRANQELGYNLLEDINEQKQLEIEQKKDEKKIVVVPKISNVLCYGIVSKDECFETDCSVLKSPMTLVAQHLNKEWYRHDHNQAEFKIDTGSNLNSSMEDPTPKILVHDHKELNIITPDNEHVANPIHSGFVSNSIVDNKNFKINQVQGLSEDDLEEPDI